ncbi:flagellin [Nocardioides sp. SR21]|uniref:flagellin N-terminal helical domain-containing protein n=1 Tax=Nocardioides sp. SR21 TaxID=2919501 RepID=UPI001FAA1063|nr:flagellin [Nocardioides sp. SR21]
MPTVRMTQSMMSHQAMGGMQLGLNRLAKVQEQLATGRIINRPSDDPTGATSAMRIRTSVASQEQFVRNGEDAMGWLNQLDSSLADSTDLVRRARELAIQSTSGAVGQPSRDALAGEIDQIIDGLMTTANATYLDRPVFGGVTPDKIAYHKVAGAVEYAPTATGSQGVLRTVGDGATVRVDMEGPDAFGPEGDSVFDHLAALAAALRSSDPAGVTAAADALELDGQRLINSQAEIGARTNRVEYSLTAATDAGLRLTSSLSEIENTDMVKATVDLQLQTVAYQAALGATAKVMQPSLLDFLR